VEKIRCYIRELKENKADLVTFPELAVTGYPPQDLLCEEGFIRKNKELLEKIVKEVGNATWFKVILRAP